MSSQVQSPLYSIISLTLAAAGLVVVGLVSGLIPGVIPARTGAEEPAMQVEAKAEVGSATDAILGNPVGTTIANSGAAADQAGKIGAESSPPMAEAKPKNP